jgi:hypothetical protein
MLLALRSLWEATTEAAGGVFGSGGFIKPRRRRCRDVEVHIPSPPAIDIQMGVGTVQWASELTDAEILALMLSY